MTVKLLIGGLIALVFACNVVHGTTNGKGLLYPFEIGDTLNCHVERKTLDGRVTYVPETPPRLPFGMRVQQGDYRVFLPQDTTFRQPSLLGLNAEVQQRLLNFLGNDYNRELTAVSRPEHDAPRACDLLPAFEGSAGQRKVHIEVVEEPVPVIQNNVASDTWRELSNFGPTLLDPARFNDRTSDPDFLAPNGLETNFGGFAFRYRDLMNRHDIFCELWIAKCPLTPAWAELPQTFFPRYFAQGTCSGKNCSYPRGLFCEEDATYTVYVTVLRWDCCYNALGGQLRWDCGWRKVQVPILCDCTCACGPRFGSTTG